MTIIMWPQEQLLRFPHQLCCSVNWENWCVKASLAVSPFRSAVTSPSTVYLSCLMSPAATVTRFYCPLCDSPAVYSYSTMLFGIWDIVWVFTSVWLHLQFQSHQIHLFITTGLFKRQVVTDFHCIPHEPYCLFCHKCCQSFIHIYLFPL